MPASAAATERAEAAASSASIAGSRAIRWIARSIASKSVHSWKGWVGT